MNDFDRALPIILKFEGGYVNDPNDHGGATNQGITQKVYDTYRTKLGQTTQDVKLIAGPEVYDIYLTNYWKVANCDQMSWPINLAVFDCAVNAGVKQSIRLLQSSVGVTPVDGQWGPDTLAASKTVSLTALLLNRAWFYDDLARKDPTQQKFLPGWIYRTHQLYNLAK